MDSISWWRTAFDGGEIDKIATSIERECISQGAVTEEFENLLAQTLGVPHVVATTSGSSALLMAMMALDVGPGDEVLVPNRTWIATAHAPLMLGAKVVLVDVEPDRPTMDAGDIEHRITERTKAIIPAHLNGRACNMQTIRSIAAAHDIRVVEDAAQALGVRTPAGALGTQSEAGCFSLSVAKLISTGQGGFVVTGDAGINDKLRSIRTHGVDSVIDVEWQRPGFNFRFTDILASIGVVQLGQLKARVRHVVDIHERYMEALPELSMMEPIPVDIEAGEIPIYVEVLCSERNRVIEFLQHRGIQTRPFYPDLDKAQYFDSAGEYPNSRRFGMEGLFLPCGPTQSLDNVDRVIEALREF